MEHVILATTNGEHISALHTFRETWDYTLILSSSLRFAWRRKQQQRSSRERQAIVWWCSPSAYLCLSTAWPPLAARVFLSPLWANSRVLSKSSFCLFSMLRKTKDLHRCRQGLVCQAYCCCRHWPFFAMSNGSSSGLINTIMFIYCWELNIREKMDKVVD